MSRLLRALRAATTMGLAVVLLGPAVSSARGELLLLDTFDGPLGALGQNRELSNTVFENPFNFPDPVSTTVDEGLGLYLFSTKAGVEAAGFITYDRFPGDSLDAIAAGVVGFQLDFLAVDQQFPLVIELDTLDMMGEVVGTAIALTFVEQGDSQVIVGLDRFTLEGEMDLSNIGQVVLAFNAFDVFDISLDFALQDFFAIVPSPSTAVLLALAGLVARRPRRRYSRLPG